MVGLLWEGKVEYMVCEDIAREGLVWKDKFKWYGRVGDAMHPTGRVWYGKVW